MDSNISDTLRSTCLYYVVMNKRVSHNLQVNSKSPHACLTVVASYGEKNNSKNIYIHCTNQKTTEISLAKEIVEGKSVS